MKSKKLNISEIEPLTVSSLPTRPTAPTSMGGKGYTSIEMKAAFDKLPLYLFEKLSLLIDDLLGEGDESFVGNFETGIREGHNLNDLIADLKSGALAEYLAVGDSNLYQEFSRIKERLALIEERLGIS